MGCNAPKRGELENRDSLIVSGRKPDSKQT